MLYRLGLFVWEVTLRQSNQISFSETISDRIPASCLSHLIDGVWCLACWWFNQTWLNFNSFQSIWNNSQHIFCSRFLLHLFAPASKDSVGFSLNKIGSLCVAPFHCETCIHTHSVIIAVVTYLFPLSVFDANGLNYWFSTIFFVRMRMYAFSAFFTVSKSILLTNLDWLCIYFNKQNLMIIFMGNNI